MRHAESRLDRKLFHFQSELIPKTETKQISFDHIYQKEGGPISISITFSMVFYKNAHRLGRDTLNMISHHLQAPDPVTSCERCKNAHTQTYNFENYI